MINNNLSNVFKGKVKGIKEESQLPQIDVGMNKVDKVASKIAMINSNHPMLEAGRTNKMDFGAKMSFNPMTKGIDKANMMMGMGTKKAKFSMNMGFKGSKMNIGSLDNKAKLFMNMKSQNKFNLMPKQQNKPNLMFNKTLNKGSFVMPNIKGFDTKVNQTIGMGMNKVSGYDTKINQMIGMGMNKVNKVSPKEQVDKAQMLTGGKVANSHFLNKPQNPVFAKLMGDYDKDKVINMLDCKVFNRFKQGPEEDMIEKNTGMAWDVLPSDKGGDISKKEFYENESEGFLNKYNMTGLKGQKDMVEASGKAAEEAFNSPNYNQTIAETIWGKDAGIEVVNEEPQTQAERIKAAEEELWGKDATPPTEDIKDLQDKFKELQGQANILFKKDDRKKMEQKAQMWDVNKQEWNNIPEEERIKIEAKEERNRKRKIEQEALNQDGYVPVENLEADKYQKLEQDILAREKQEKIDKVKKVGAGLWSATKTGWSAASKAVNLAKAGVRDIRDTLGKKGQTREEQILASFSQKSKDYKLPDYSEQIRRSQAMADDVKLHPSTRFAALQEVRHYKSLEQEARKQKLDYDKTELKSRTDLMKVLLQQKNKAETKKPTLTKDLASMRLLGMGDQGIKGINRMTEVVTSQGGMDRMSQVGYMSQVNRLVPSAGATTGVDAITRAERLVSRPYNQQLANMVLAPSGLSKIDFYPKKTQMPQPQQMSAQSPQMETEMVIPEERVQFAQTQVHQVQQTPAQPQKMRSPTTGRWVTYSRGRYKPRQPKAEQPQQ